MKRILRSFLTLLMLVVWASGFAQEVTLDFTNSKTWNLPVGSENSVKTQKSYSNGTYSITINASAGHFLVGDKEDSYSLLFGKKNATLTLPAFDFDVEKIVLKKSTQSSISPNVIQNIYVGSTAVSTPTTGADKDQTYEIKADYQKAGKIYVLKISSKHNTQISKIEIYKAASSSTATTVSFPKKSLNLIDGDKATQGQAAVVKAGEKILTGATVTYSFESADGIFKETLASEGLFSLNAGTYGTGKVTATFDGGEIDGVTYAKSSASYIVNYSAAKTPVLTFSPANVTVKQYEESSFVKPTITFTDERGDDVTESAELTYSVSPEGVVEIDKNSGDITKWLAPGVATVKAHTDYGYDASYTLTYEKVKLATTLTLDEGLKTIGKIGETLDCPAWTLKAGENVLSGKTVALTSDNEDVVKVDGNQLKLVAAGSANITLSFNSDDDYQSSNVSYELTVVDPNAAEVTFDFTDPASLKYSNSETTNLKEGDKFVNGQITLTNKKNGSTNPVNRLFKSKTGFYLGFYQNGEMILSAADGYTITGVSYTIVDKNTLKINGVSGKEGWTGNAKSVILSIDKGASATKIETMTVAYSKLSSIGLDESKDNAETISGNADKTVNVKLTRTLKADVWNTFCVPFDVTVAGSPLEGATIKQIASVEEKTDGAVINFEDAPATLEAGKAYLVRTATAIVNPTFNGVTVKNVVPTNCSRNANYQLIGIYSPLNIDASLYGKVFGINNQDKLAKVMKDTSIKGMRAYFLLANSATAAKLNFGGELTGIDAVDNGEAVMTGKVYNLNGQYVGNSLEGLKKGVYVVNGKKVLK